MKKKINIYTFAVLSKSSLTFELKKKKKKYSNWNGVTIGKLETMCLMVSHLYFFATLNKERNSPHLQLSRRLNGKMLVLGFLYSKSTPIVQQKNAKKPTCQTIAFFAKY